MISPGFSFAVSEGATTIFTSLYEAFCELDMKNTYKNAKHDYDLFNSFSTPVLSLFITKIDNCAECRSRKCGFPEMSTQAGSEEAGKEV